MGNKSNRGFWYWIWKYYSLSILARKLHKKREIAFELSMLKRKKEMCPGCMRTFGILQCSFFAIQTSQIPLSTPSLLYSISHQISKLCILKLNLIDFFSFSLGFFSIFRTLCNKSEMKNENKIISFILKGIFFHYLLSIKPFFFLADGKIHDIVGKSPFFLKFLFIVKVNLLLQWPFFQQMHHTLTLDLFTAVSTHQ